MELSEDIVKAVKTALVIMSRQPVKPFTSGSVRKVMLTVIDDKYYVLDSGRGYVFEKSVVDAGILDDMFRTYQYFGPKTMMSLKRNGHHVIAVTKGQFDVLEAKYEEFVKGSGKTPAANSRPEDNIFAHAAISNPFNYMLGSNGTQYLLGAQYGVEYDAKSNFWKAHRWN